MAHHALLNYLPLLILLATAPLRAEDQYRAVFSEDLARVSVEACFDGAAPAYLHQHRSAGRFTRALSANGRAVKIRPRQDRLQLPSLPDNSCLAWQVDLARAATPANQRLALRIDSGYVTSGNLWFWRDNDRRPLRITVELPAGVSLSTPWREAGQQGGHPVYRPWPTPAAWSSRIAVGKFPIQRIEVPGATLRLAAVGKLSQRQRDTLAAWMGEAARSVAAVSGNFPQPQPQVLVVPSGNRGEAVGWAHVVRGGGVATELFVDENRSLQQLRDDWTATHELSHMLLPYVASSDRWLSEGLASYYQNVLRARDGRLSEQEAWQRLHSGFLRGRAATRRGEDLDEATRSGWGDVMRIYWSGAAMMLKADAQLRRLSGGRQSLDSALAALHDCCIDSPRSWRARELFAELDQLTGHSVFADLYRAHVRDESFPDTSDLYDRLGLRARKNTLVIEPQAPWSRIRYYIMNGDKPRLEASTSSGSH